MAANYADVDMTEMVLKKASDDKIDMWAYIYKKNKVVLARQ